MSLIASHVGHKQHVDYGGYITALEEFYMHLQESSTVLLSLPPIDYSFDGKIGDGVNLNRFADNRIVVYTGKTFDGISINPKKHYFSQNEITASYIAVAHECEHIKQLHEFQTNPNVDLYDVYQHIYEYGFHKSYYVSKNYTNNPLELKAERNALLVTYDYLQEQHHATPEQAFEMIRSSTLERTANSSNCFLSRDSMESFTCMNDFTKAFDTQIAVSKDVRRYFKYADNTPVDYDVTTLDDDCEYGS